MIKAILRKLWPVIVPMAFYVIWKIIAKKREKKGLPPLFCSDGEKWLLYSVIFVAIGCFVYMAISQHGQKETYQPTSVRDGKIVPSQIKTHD